MQIRAFEIAIDGNHAVAGPCQRDAQVCDNESLADPALAATDRDDPRLRSTRRIPAPSGSVQQTRCSIIRVDRFRGPTPHG